jgi:hypothetical protein
MGDDTAMLARPRALPWGEDLAEPASPDLVRLAAVAELRLLR